MKSLILVAILSITTTTFAQVSQSSVKAAAKSYKAMLTANENSDDSISVNGSVKQFKNFTGTTRNQVARYVHIALKDLALELEGDCTTDLNAKNAKSAIDSLLTQLTASADKATLNKLKIDALENDLLKAITTAGSGALLCDFSTFDGNAMGNALTLKTAKDGLVIFHLYMNN